MPEAQPGEMRLKLVHVFVCEQTGELGFAGAIHLGTEEACEGGYLGDEATEGDEGRMPAKIVENAGFGAHHDCLARMSGGILADEEGGIIRSIDVGIVGGGGGGG